MNLAMLLACWPVASIAVCLLWTVARAVVVTSLEHRPDKPYNEVHPSTLIHPTVGTPIRSNDPDFVSAATREVFAIISKGNQP